MKQYTIALLGFLVILLTGCTTTPPVQNPTNNNQTQAATIPAGNFLFFSPSCPHCATVTNYVRDNQLREKGIHYFELEIASNSDNANILKSIGSRCHINEEDLSVPLLWYNQTCYTSSEEIINFLQTLVPTDSP